MGKQITLSDDMAMGQGHNHVGQLVREYKQIGYKVVHSYNHPAVGQCVVVTEPEKRIVMLTDKQEDELSGIIMANMSDSFSYLLKIQNEWWHKLLGYYPYRVDRIRNKVYEVWE